MSEEEKKEYEKLKSLLYTGTISQYGKRKLIDIIEKQQKEIEELKKDKKVLVKNYDKVLGTFINKDKIKEKISKLQKEADYITIDNPTGRIHFCEEPCDYQIEVLKELLEEGE